MKTVTLEQAKRIKELGLGEDSYFCWAKDSMDENKYVLVGRNQLFPELYLPALTAEEMMDKMPDEIIIENKASFLVIYKEDNIYLSGYNCFVAFDKEDITIHQTQNKVLSIALGDLFLWLGEKQLFGDKLSFE